MEEHCSVTIDSILREEDLCEGAARTRETILRKAPRGLLAAIACFWITDNESQKFRGGSYLVPLELAPTKSGKSHPEVCAGAPGAEYGLCFLGFA